MAWRWTALHNLNPNAVVQWLLGCCVGMIGPGKSAEEMTGGLVIGEAGEVRSRVIAQMDHLLLDPNTGVPAASAQSDAFIAAGVVLVQTAVGLVLALRAEAEVGLSIVQPVVIDVVNILAALSSQDKAMHVEDDALAIDRFAAHGIAFVIPPPAPLHQKVVISIINEGIGITVGERDSEHEEYS